MNQIIIHVDMDAFYASVEMRDNPSLRGKPLIIGAYPNERGVVATCSYEARKFGVHSAMNIKEAYRLCPKGIYVHPNFDKYKAVSAKLHEIWNTYASEAEYIALDEAYLDVTEQAKNFDGAREIAKIIKQRTKDELGLTCSIGVAYSKTAAKTASEEKKPNGYFEIQTPEDFVNLIIDREVRVIYTVGEKTEEKLKSIGINTVRDIRERQDEVIRLLGKQGQWITQIAYGIDNRKVVTYRAEDAKSIGREITFQKDVLNDVLLNDVIFLLSLCVFHRAKRVGLYGNGVSLKITYSNMKTISRSPAISYCDSPSKIYQIAESMFKNVEKQPIRLIGVSVYNLSSKFIGQLTFDSFWEEKNNNKEEIIEQKLELLNKRYHLDFAGNLDKIFHGVTLYKTIEYMRKHI